MIRCSGRHWKDRLSWSRSKTSWDNMCFLLRRSVAKSCQEYGREQFCLRWIFNLHIKGSVRGYQFIHAIIPRFFQVREQEVYWLYKNYSAHIIITTGCASGEAGSGTAVWCIIFLRSSGQNESFLWVMVMYFFDGGVSFFWGQNEILKKKFCFVFLQEVAEYYSKHAHSPQRWHTPKIMEDLKVW